eukprot:COSAG05_NODE_546_length_8763_cov_12.991228_2_plen_391_part_00
MAPGRLRGAMGGGGGPNSQRRGGRRGDDRGGRGGRRGDRDGDGGGGRGGRRGDRGGGRGRGGSRGGGKPPQTPGGAAAAAFAAFMAQQRLALDHWRQEKLNKRVTLQKVSMSGESQDMVSDLLHEISGADAEDVIFGAEGQMAELGTQLQHSDEAKFLLRALLELRFRRDHAQQACAFVFAENAGDLVGKDHLLTSALDWLCLHVEDKHLPRQFASLSRIEVVVGQKKAVTTASMPPPNFGPERRIDPEDGNAYTLEEFIDAYGGTKEWEAQAHQSARFHAQAAAHAAAAKEQYELAVASQRHASDISAVQQQQIFRLMSFGFSRRKIVEALEAQAGQREMADEDEVLGMLLRGILERRRRGAAADAEQARQARLTSLTGSVRASRIPTL